MKLLSQITMAIVLLPLLVQGQQNLVPNGSFEEHSQCPDNISLVHFAILWANTGGGASPDYFNVCGPPIISPPDTFPVAGVPENVFGFQSAHSGEAYAGIYTFSRPTVESREYLQIELLQPIYASIRYKVSFYVSLADNLWNAVGTLGAYFTESEVVNANGLVYEVEPQIESPAGAVYDDKVNWVLVEDTFTSRYGGEQYMLIGNFRKDIESNIVLVDSGLTPNGFNQSYYYIDDVSVIALDSLPSGVEEAEQNQGTYNIYPNPSNGTFTIAHTLHTNPMAHLEVYDLLGQCILTKHFRGSAPLEVDLTGVSSGLYTVRILIDNELKFSEKVSVIRP